MVVKILESSSTRKCGRVRKIQNQQKIPVSIVWTVNHGKLIGKEELQRIDENPNYMTVPAALRELEKIEMIRDHDHIYRETAH